MPGQLQGTTARQIPAFKGDGKRVPRNQKYSNVSGKVDTGASTSKSQARAEYLAANYKYKKGEIFKRMKASTLAQLIIDDAEAMVEYDIGDLDEAATFNGGQMLGRHVASPEVTDDIDSTTSARTSRSTLLSLVHGVGAMDVASAEAEAASPRTVVEKPPFILLDLRDPQDFEECHIRGATNYHHVRLARAQNYWTPEVFEYINKPDRIIIAYDEDESIAPKAATTIVQRGVDNLFMLSGGLKVFADKIPEGLINGVLPKSCRPAKGSKAVDPRPSLAPLTLENISLIRGKLEELEAASITGSMSHRSTSRASTNTARSNTTSRKTSWK